MLFFYASILLVVYTYYAPATNIYVSQSIWGFSHFLFITKWFVFPAAVGNNRSSESKYSFMRNEITTSVGKYTIMANTS